MSSCIPFYVSVMCTFLYPIKLILPSLLQSVPICLLYPYFLPLLYIPLYVPILNVYLSSTYTYVSPFLHSVISTFILLIYLNTTTLYMLDLLLVCTNSQCILFAYLYVSLSLSKPRSPSYTFFMSINLFLHRQCITS